MIPTRNTTTLILNLKAPQISPLQKAGKRGMRTALVIQGLREGVDSIPAQGTETPYAARCSQTKKAWDAAYAHCPSRAQMT